MNIIIFTDIPDSLHLAIAADTLRGCGHSVKINPNDEVSAQDTWLLLNVAKVSVDNMGEFLRVLKDPDLNVKVGIVGKILPLEFNEFLEPSKGNLAKFEHFSSWDNLIYRHLWK